MKESKSSKPSRETRLLAKIDFKLSSDKSKVSPTNNQKRKDWSEAFQEMAKNGDDELLIPDVFEDENLEDWTWQEPNYSN